MKTGCSIDQALTSSSQIKSLGHGEYEAMAIALGDEPDCDLEVFCPDMSLESLGLDDNREFIPILWQHGRDPRLKNRRLAKAAYEFLPRVGLKVRWRFERPNDPLVRDIRTLIDEGTAALSSASTMSEKKKQGAITIIEGWKIYEISITPNACAISGRTRVAAAKDAERLSLQELMRLRGLTETQLLREQSEDLRHQVMKTLGEQKCGRDTCERCNHTAEWLQHQRNKYANYVASEVRHRENIAINLTAHEAQERLRKADEILKAVQALPEANIAEERVKMNEMVIRAQALVREATSAKKRYEALERRELRDYVLYSAT